MNNETTGDAKLIVKERALVIPGDTLAVGMDFLPGSGCYRENKEVKSKLLGLTRIKDRFLSVIPISGAYLPKSGDGIIATVSDMQNTFWILDINSPYDATLHISEGVQEFIDTNKTDLSVYYKIGDIIYAKIKNVTKARSVQLSMNDYRAKKLIDGVIIKIVPSKVPRIIGKQGSMIELIKKHTGCHIVVGQNGIVWLKGEEEALAIRTIKLIEKEAHTSGLTKRITEFLEKENPVAETPVKEQTTEQPNGGAVNE
jgi:exosome complex component RRP4